MSEYRLDGNIIVECEPEYLIEDSDIDPLVWTMMKHKMFKIPTLTEVYRACHYTGNKMQTERWHYRDAIRAYEQGDLILPGDLADWKEYHFILKRFGVGVPELTLEQKIKHWFINLFA